MAQFRLAKVNNEELIAFVKKYIGHTESNMFRQFVQDFEEEGYISDWAKAWSSTILQEADDIANERETRRERLERELGPEPEVLVSEPEIAFIEPEPVVKLKPKLKKERKPHVDLYQKTEGLYNSDHDKPGMTWPIPAYFPKSFIHLSGKTPRRQTAS